MSFKSVDQPSYMDNVPVKISEKYKPPRKINLAVSYPQKLASSSLNGKSFEESPCYDFSLETNVLQKISAWKSLRQANVKEREERQERIQREKLERMKEDEEEEEGSADGTPESDRTSTGNLLPFTPSTHNHILTPILLKHSETSANPLEATDRSPFNISDFEADNSSPFDNMELKTINDMAELAQVLRRDDSANSASCYPPQNYHHHPQQHQDQRQCLNYYAQQQTSYLPPLPPHQHQQQQQQQPQQQQADHYYSYMLTDAVPKPLNSVSPPQMTTNLLPEKKASFRSVPDIVKALQNELDNTHIDVVATAAARTKTTQDVVNVNGTNQHSELQNCYYNLPVSLQQLSTKISSMGFPLPRVARVVQIIGDDQKKVVDHLLVMTELLDLGFQEEEVSKALLQCNNDRDKAIDTLIS